MYSLPQLNSTIQDLLENAGAKQTPNPILTISEDTATSKVILRFNYTDTEVDFTGADNFREMLGYDALNYGPYAVAPHNLLAPNIAKFNTVNYFLIHSDIVSNGLLFNSTYNNTIAKVPIDVPTGSQIVYTPFNPPKIQDTSLVGSHRTNLRFWLTDDKNRSVNTNSENWGLRLSIEFET